MLIAQAPFANHAAQKCRPAIGTHPVPGDLHQVRVHECPPALETSQNCLDSGFLTHRVSPSCAKVTLSLAQVASRAKYYYLAEKFIPSRCRSIPSKLWIALWRISIVIATRSIPTELLTPARFLASCSWRNWHTQLPQEQPSCEFNSHRAYRNSTVL